MWERVKPTIQQGREQWANKQFLAHLEKAASCYETWIETRSPGHIATMREFMKQMRPQLGKAVRPDIWTQALITSEPATAWA